MAWLRTLLDANSRRARIERLRGRRWRPRLAAGGEGLRIGSRVEIRSPGQLVAGKNVIIGDYVFLDCLSQSGVVLEEGVCLDRNVWVKCSAFPDSPSGGLIIGAFTSVGAYSMLGPMGGSRIGSRVQIGQRVNLHANQHNFDDPSAPIYQQGVCCTGITIEDDCWIGSGAIILDGVTIGRGSVIGAGAVVTRDIPPASVAVGVPARVIKHRGGAS